MTNRKNLVAVGSEEGQPAETVELVAAEGDAATEEAPTFAEDFISQERPAPRLDRFRWIVPALAVLAIVDWTVFFSLVHRRAILGGASPEQWSVWIVDWSVPVMLVVALWLLAMRNSHRESARFGRAARELAR